MDKDNGNKTFQFKKFQQFWADITNQNVNDESEIDINKSFMYPRKTLYSNSKEQEKKDKI